MNNIEIKFAVNSLDNFEKFLQEDDDCLFIRTIQQTDIYFDAPAGRLKLRIFPVGQSELIGYQRENQTNPRLSNYYIYPSENPDQLKKVLSEILGIKTTVVKVRKLWKYKNVRIHLDSVSKLGNFVELESVIDETNPVEQSTRNLDYILARFSTFEMTPVPLSYSDMILERESRDE